MRDKQFKNLDEQLEIFKYKGLIIEDEEFAKTVLLRENYFFINGYRHLFMKSANNKRYIEGTTFEELYSLFLFDRQFRNIILGKRIKNVRLRKFMKSASAESYYYTMSTKDK